MPSRWKTGRKRSGHFRRLIGICLALLFLLPSSPAGAKGESISVVAPNGGETLSGGDHFKVRWNATSDLGVFRLFYSTDGGRTYPNSIATVSNGLKKEYNWSIPDNVNTTTARVRIAWLSSDRFPYEVWAQDESDQNFTIRPSVTVRFTQVDARVTNARYSLVRWDLFDPERRVLGLDLQQRINDNGSWGPWQGLGGAFGNISASEGGIWWQAPHFTQATVQLRIRALSDLATHAVLSFDDSMEINVSSPTVLVIRPNGGETVLAGRPCSIEWTSSPDPERDIGSIGIEYSVDSGASWTTVTEGASNTHTYSWNVPAGLSSDRVRIKVVAEYSEWIPFTWDSSDRDFTVTTDSNLVAVALYKPNPPVPGGLALKGGEVFWINWTVTGPSSEISSYRILLSTDNGTAFDHILDSAAGTTTKLWNVPRIDTTGALVRLEATLRNGTVRRSTSNHPFIIFTNESYNRQAVADAGPNQEVAEGSTVRLHGGRSYDMDREAFNYSWRQADTTGFDVELNGSNTSSPEFVPQILDYVVDLLFELTVDDGHYHDPATSTFENVSYVSVHVLPLGPRLGNATQLNAMPGIPVRLEGEQLRGCQILVGGVPTGMVPTSPTPEFPDPDHNYNFTVADTVPHRTCELVVRNRAGESAWALPLTVYPVPQYCYDWGFKFDNPAKPELTYPLDIGAQGAYHDTFGDSVYCYVWICMGVPIWIPFYGWVCIGYAYTEPAGPDPIAYGFYCSHYKKAARNGECFGVSSTSLQLSNVDISVLDFNSTVGHTNELLLQGELERHIDFMQGSFLSRECQGLVQSGMAITDSPSVENTSGMGLFLKQVQDGLADGDGGLISFWVGRKGHAVVPYLVEDQDATTTRIYVYDPNRWYTATQRIMESRIKYGFWPNNIPPYIEINKTGPRWKWSFTMGSGDTWEGTGQIVYVPYSVVNGPRTLLASSSGILDALFGDAGSSVEDSGGSRIGWEPNGSLTSQIAGAYPLMTVGGDEWPLTGYVLPAGNYTTRITGTADGLYDWSRTFDGNSSFYLEGAGIGNGTRDTISINYTDGNPLGGRMSYRTDGGQKAYNLTQAKRFGNESARPRTRTYKLLNSTLYGDSEAVVNTTPDCNALVFFNNGPHSITFDVEFQGNVVSQEAWNSSRPAGMPTVRQNGITIGPYQTLTIRPSNWLNLMNSTVIIEGEGVICFPDKPLNLRAFASSDRVSLTWDPPAYDGGSAISSYIVWRGDSAANLTPLADLGNVTSYTDMHVKAGKKYYYAVMARNEFGAGDAATAVSATVPKTEEPVGGGIPIWLILVIVVIAAIAVVGVAVVMMRKRPRA